MFRFNTVQEWKIAYTLHYNLLLQGVLARVGHEASFTAFVGRLEVKKARKHCFESLTSDISLPIF
jgi:hypothetical protein